MKHMLAMMLGVAVGFSVGQAATAEKKTKQVPEFVDPSTVVYERPPKASPTPRPAAWKSPHLYSF